MKKNSIAIITARGGSKRIPKKNIRDFCGKPIIAYSIESALKCGLFDEVMVSTDSEEIAEIAKKYGANVPFLRSEETSNDYATTADVIMEVIDKYKELGKEFEFICCIYPTAPFITSERLAEALRTMKTYEPEEVLPVVEFSAPPQRGMVIREGRLNFMYPEYRTVRSQDIEKMYHDAGQFYIYNAEKYIAKKGKNLTDIMPFVLPELEVQDIDNESDWKLAEVKYTLLHG